VLGRPRRFLLITVAAIASATTTFDHPHDAIAATCATGTGAEAVESAFANRVQGLAGADYQRAMRLPDGRMLWVFQDAFVERPGRDEQLLHNVGLVQDGSCLTLLRGGTSDDPASWIGAGVTEPYHRWFWPLGGTITADGTIALFVAELRERGSTYLSQTEPVATWVATIDPATLAVLGLEPAPDPGPGMYGWSVASDDAHTYLYGHCYRQFGYGFLGHDRCAAEVTVARTARGDLDGPLRYWDGEAWVADPAAAANIAPAAGPDGTPRKINPMQIAYVDGRWIAVTKEGDWWGDTIYLDRAPAPTGPWTTEGVVRPEPLGPEHNTYFASLVPGADGRVVVGLSNNRWDGQHADTYRPTFRTLPLSRWGAADVPGGRPAPSPPDRHCAPARR
jgi:hypothetical protein